MRPDDTSQPQLKGSSFKMYQSLCRSMRQLDNGFLHWELGYNMAIPKQGFDSRLKSVASASAYTRLQAAMQPTKSVAMNRFENPDPKVSPNEIEIRFSFCLMAGK